MSVGDDILISDPPILGSVSVSVPVPILVFKVSVSVTKFYRYWFLSYK